MKSTDSAKIRIIVIFVVFIPVFLAVNFGAQKLRDAHRADFAHYWQSGRMILEGKNIYDSNEWLAEKSRYGTAPQSESTFQYPLPFAILMAPLSLLDVTSAFIIWMLIGEVSILTSIFVLLSFYPQRSMLFELLAIAAAFLFRPTFIVLRNGQIIAEMLLFISLSAYLFSRDKWFYGGLTASLTILKPSLGAPLLLLTGLWLLSKKRWHAIAGLAVGALLLLGLGVLYNPHWVADYLSTGKNNFDKYYGMQTTLWGGMGLFFDKANRWGIAAGAAGVGIILGVTTYFVMKKNTGDDSLKTLALLVSTTLLIAPYSWNYDQLLLFIPIVYILSTLSILYGDGKTALVSLVIIGLPILMALIAHTLGHDVWSVLITVIIWASMLLLPSHILNPKS